MIEGLKPYPAYKKSGHRYIGNIPAHWEIRKLKHLTRFINGLPFKPTDWCDSGLAIIRIQNLNGSNHFNYTRRRDLPDSLLIRPGELLFAWSGNRGTSFGPFIWNRNFDGYLNQHIFKLSGYDLETRYFAALLRVITIHIEEEKTHGIIGLVHITKPELSGTSVPIAPPAEQAAIVRFLDHANRKIDGFIRAKRKLIGLLNEQKQAIIHRAVTCGLNPDVPMKPSASFWFPEVPESWDIVNMRRVIRAAIDGPHFSPQYQDKGIPFLSARNVRPDKWLLDDAKFISQSNYKLFCQRVRPEVGDVLYTKGGTTGVARAVDLDFPFQVWVHIAVLKLDKQLISPEFLAFCLNSPRCYEQAQLFTRGATNQDLGLGRMKQIELPLPPTLAEQVKIVIWLKAQLETFTTAISRTEREIALMQEYRTRLTADLVTGKLDVREAAAKLPDPPAEAVAEPITDDSLEESESEDADT